MKPFARSYRPKFTPIMKNFKSSRNSKKSSNTSSKLTTSSNSKKDSELSLKTTIKRLKDAPETSWHFTKSMLPLLNDLSKLKVIVNAYRYSFKEKYAILEQMSIKLKLLATHKLLLIKLLEDSSFMLMP